MSFKLLRDLALAGLAAYVLHWLLPYRSGQPIGLYTLGSIGLAGFGVYCLRAITKKHKDIYPRYVIESVLFALGMLSVSYSYAIIAAAAWQGGPKPDQHLYWFLIGMGLLLVGTVRALGNARRKPKQR